ncbi:MAG: hypothetical protein ACI8V0_000934, partial [Pseudohongiellaceae bacterium]
RKGLTLVYRGIVCHEYSKDTSRKKNSNSGRRQTADGRRQTADGRRQISDRRGHG